MGLLFVFSKQLSNSFLTISFISLMKAYDSFTYTNPLVIISGSAMAITLSLALNIIRMN